MSDLRTEAEVIAQTLRFVAGDIWDVLWLEQAAGFLEAGELNVTPDAPKPRGQVCPLCQTVDCVDGCPVKPLRNPGPCGGCKDTGWVEDQGWEPRWPGDRRSEPTHWGWLACGVCNDDGGREFDFAKMGDR